MRALHIAALLPIVFPRAGASVGTAGKAPEYVNDLLRWEPSLGSFAFRVTTSSAEAQQLFGLGLMLLYNFDQPMARAAFQAALEKDDQCAMCAWGVAHSYGPFLNAPTKGPDELTLGRAAALSAVELLGARRSEFSPKEQALIDTMAVRYPEEPTTGDQLESYRLYASRIRAARGDPALSADADMMVFDAEAMMDLLSDVSGYHFYISRGDDLPPVERPETAEASTLLRRALAATNQTHPYAQHMLIHSTEMSNSEAETAVKVAAQLLKNMRGLQNQHLQHMTSHTFLRTGRYHEAVVANEGAVHSDATFLHHHLLPYGPGHNSAFLVVSACWGGERKAAYKYARVMQQIFADLPGQLDYPDGSIGWSHPMLVAVRFGDWNLVYEQDMVPPGDFGGSWLYGYGVARHLSMVIADVHLGRWQEAQANLQSLRTLMSQVAALGDTHLRNLSLLANHTASAVLAQASGYSDLAIHALADAVAVEMGMEYSEPPSWLLPTRECLGQALLEQGAPVDAEAIFRSALYGYSWHAEPNCGWALFGLRASLEHQEPTSLRKEEIRNLTMDIAIAWQHADVPLQSACQHFPSRRSFTFV